MIILKLKRSHKFQHIFEAFQLFLSLLLLLLLFGFMPAGGHMDQKWSIVGHYWIQ
jgi:hypothetical protein